MHTVGLLLTKIPLLPRVVSLHVVLWGIIISSLLLWGPKTNSSYTKTPLPLSSFTATHVNKDVVNGKPSSIKMDRLNINLVVKDGVYDERTASWTLSDDAAYYATMTTLPNNQHGNTFIYGHNTRRIFAQLSGLVPGDVITITTTNGHIFTYSYTHDAIIPPDLTSVLYAKSDTPQLTIMTCEGIWSQARRLMYFDLQGAE